MTFILIKFGCLLGLFFIFWLSGFKLHWPTFFVTLIAMIIGLELR